MLSINSSCKLAQDDFSQVESLLAECCFETEGSARIRMRNFAEMILRKDNKNFYPDSRRSVFPASSKLCLEIERVLVYAGVKIGA